MSAGQWTNESLLFPHSKRAKVKGTIQLKNPAERLEILMVMMVLGVCTHHHRPSVYNNNNTRSRCSWTIQWEWGLPLLLERNHDASFFFSLCSWTCRFLSRQRYRRRRPVVTTNVRSFVRESFSLAPIQKAPFSVCCRKPFKLFFLSLSPPPTHTHEFLCQSPTIIIGPLSHSHTNLYIELQILSKRI